MEQPKIYGPQLVPDVPREGTSQGTQSSNDFLEKYPQVLLEEIQNTVCQRKIFQEISRIGSQTCTPISLKMWPIKMRKPFYYNPPVSHVLWWVFHWLRVALFLHVTFSSKRSPKKYDKTMMFCQKQAAATPTISTNKIATSEAWPYCLQRSFYSAGAFVKTGVSPGALTASRACHEETFTSKWGHVFCVYLIIEKTKTRFFGSSKKSSHWMMWVWKNVLANLGEVFFVKQTGGPLKPTGQTLPSTS